MDENFQIRLLTELLDVKKKLDDIQKDISLIKLENSALRQQIQQNSQIQQSHSSQNQSGQAAQQPQTESSRGSFDRGATSTHPRTGGLAPKDVAIEKFFYSGAKK